MNPGVSEKDVCAIITTYRPDPFFHERVRSVLAQVGLVVIVDDGFCDENKAILEKWFQGADRIIVFHNPANMGIAASLNTGIALAKEKGFQWFLTLDDDSMIGADTVRKMADALMSIKARNPIGMIGMSWTDPHQGSKPGTGHANRMGYLEKRGIITSGSLFPLTVFEIGGPFREEFFIDMVDYDFCLRLRSKGFSIIKLEDVGFEHSLGCTTLHRIAGIRIKTFNHNPMRVYYRFRNTMVIIREYLTKDILFSGVATAVLFKTFCSIVLFEQNKALKIREAAKGMMDGVFGRLGKQWRVHS